VFATPLRYTACVTENTERSPWETIAISRGYSADDNVITCAMVESPRLCYDDASQTPARLLTGLADSMSAMCSWNQHVRSDMVVAMGPEHASICARAGMSRAVVHAWLIAHAGRKVRDLKGGGNWRPERARAHGTHRICQAGKQTRGRLASTRTTTSALCRSSRTRAICILSSPAAGAHSLPSAMAGAAAAALCMALIGRNSMAKQTGRHDLWQRLCAIITACN
jgi:hypothetical protein